MRRYRALAVCTTVVAIALLTGVLAPPASAATAVALWRMEDTSTTMADSSGYGRHGTSSKVQLRQPGWRGYGYRFATTGAYVTVPSASSLNPGTSTFEVTARVRFSTIPPGGYVDTYDIIRKGLSWTSGGNWKMEISPTGAGRCEFRGTTATARVTGSRSLADGAWHTITCRRTSTALTLVVDGTSKTLARATGSISNSSPVLLGAKNGSGEDQYVGFMDEVSISRG